MKPVRLENYRAILNYLEQFEKDTFDAVTEGMKTAAEPVAENAARLYPSGTALKNWGRWVQDGKGRNGGGGRNLSYDKGKIAASIRPTTQEIRRIGSAQKNVIGIEVMDPAGSIFHTAGFGRGRYRYRGNRGLTFRENMRKANPRPRPLWEAVQKAPKSVERAILAELKKAEQAFNRRQGK